MSNNNSRWEWFETKNEWKIYDDNIKNILDDCLNNNKPIAKFTLNSIQFEVNLNTMIQKNLKTKYEREIRYCLRKNNKSDYYTWQWQDDDKKWSYYTPNSVVHIENEYLKDNNSKFNLNVTNNASYSIDFNTMKQINTKTSFSRSIKRIKSECDDENSVEDEESSQKSAESSSSSARKVLPPRAAKQKSLSLNNNNKNKPIKEEPNVDSENDENNDKKCSNKSSITEKKIKEEKKESCDENDSDDSTNTLKRKIQEKSEGKKRKRLDSSEKTKEEEENDDKSIAKSSSAPSNSIKTIRYTGKVAVDETFINTVSSEYHVYVENDDVYDCMLNQTNLQYNNNKYYLLQILKHTKKNQYCVWFRWGRVGKNGQSSSQNCGSDLNKAKAIFCEKFFDKTKNEWQDRHLFEKQAGKYDIVHKDYDINSDDENEEEKEDKIKKEKKTEKESPKSKLNKPIQDLVEFLYDIQEMEAILREMKYDVKKAPLGKLSSNQIKIGLAALEKIEDYIKNNNSGKALLNACNDYYTRIPHDFGMRTPPLINTKALLKKEFVLLEALTDIEIAIKAINKKSEIIENPIDRYYDELECDIKIVDENDKMYKYIDDYLHKTHAPTHNTYEMEIMSVYEINKESEKVRFRKELGNRMLLWHGSMRTNWAGILTTGLRVASKTEEVSNGCMFGKACYFADCSSKSANYCYPDKQKNIGIIALCEVALGECNEIIAATGEDYDSNNLPKNKSSTKGLGRSEPNRKEWITLDDGLIIPIGKLVPTGVNNPNGYTLLYNEYAVYNAYQIKLRYLIKVKFQFNF